MIAAVLSAAAAHPVWTFLALAAAVAGLAWASEAGDQR